MAEYNHDEWLKGVLARNWEAPKPVVEESAPPADDVGGFQNAFAQSIGNQAAGFGQFGADFIPGVSKDNSLKSWGDKYAAAHPTAIHTLEDIKSRPLTAVAEGVGMALGYGLPLVATRGVGALPLGLSKAARAVQALSKAAPFVTAAAPSYGGIREAQGSDTWQDKALALPAALTVGAIETKFGPQEWALKSLTTEGRAALAKKFTGDTLAKRVGKGVGLGAVVEGAEELVQNPIEQAASYQNPLSEESMRETAFGGVMGAIGGGVLGGGMSAVTGRKTNLLKPTERVSEPTTDPRGMTPDMFTGEVGPGKDVYQTAFEEASRIFEPTDAQGELFAPREIPGSTGYDFKPTKVATTAAQRAAMAKEGASTAAAPTVATTARDRTAMAKRQSTGIDPTTGMPYSPGVTNEAGAGLPPGVSGIQFAPPKAKGKGKKGAVAAAEQQAATPKVPSNWADIEATVSDHVANGRMTEEQADAVKAEAKTPAKARKMIEKAIVETKSIVPVDTAVTAMDTFTEKLPKQQKSVFGLVRAAAENNELDKYISADGEWQATAMGEALGMSKQAAHKAVRDLRKKLDSEAGGDVKAALAARTASVRSYEAPAEATLGLSPAQQTSSVNQDDLFGSEEGAQQSMGVISSVGGSQGEVEGAEIKPDYALVSAVSKAEGVSKQGAADMIKGLNKEMAAKPAAEENAEISEKALAAARENKMRSLVEAAQSGDLVEAVNTWNDFVGALPGVEEVPAKLSANEENVDFLADWVNAYIDVRSEVEAHQEAGKFIDEVGAYEYEVKRIVRNRQRDAQTVVKAKPGEAQKTVGGETKTSHGAVEDGVSAEEQVVGKADVSKVKVVAKKRRSVKLSETDKPGKSHTTKSLWSVIDKMFIYPAKARKIVTIYATQQEAVDAGELKAGMRPVGGWQVGNKVGLIAENIQPGQEMGVILHEVGVHLGMEKLVGKENKQWLSDKVGEWASRNDGSVESGAAKRAIKRALKSSSKDKSDENIAYMVEELVNAGVNPKAGGSSEVDAWYTRLLAATTAALKKLGFKSSQFTGQNLVDLAFGAANIELEGSAEAALPGEKKLSEVGSRSTVTYNSEYAMKKAEKFLRKKGGYKTVSTAKTPEGTYEVTRMKVERKKFSEVATAEKSLVEAMNVSQQVTDTKHILKKSVGWMTYLHDLVRKVEKEMPSAKTWYEGILKTQETRLKMERDAEKVAAMASGMKEAEYKQVNSFLENSTVSQKWGYAPEWNKDVVVDADLAAQWNALSKDQQKIADAVFKHGFDSIARKRDLFKKLGVQDVMSNLWALTGPYAPLKRFGKFVAVLKSQKLVDAEAKLKAEDIKANRDEVELLKKDGANYKVSSFDTPGLAEQFVKEEGSKYAFADSFASGEKIASEQAMSYQAMQTVMSAVKADPSLPPQVRAEMENTVRALYLSSLDETNARQSGQKRKNTAGFHEDMVRSFLAGARADAAYVANLEHGGETNDAFYKMQEVEVKDASGRRKYQDDFNLLAEHYAENMKYDPAPIQDRVVGLTSAWQLTTSLAYHLTNMSQGFMVTLPRLAAEGNYGSALKHLLDGYKIVGDVMTGMTADLSKVKDAGMREALELAANRGILDVGIEEDLGQFDQFRTGYKAIDGTSRLASKALHKLRGVSRAVETVNRVSSGAAAYAQAIEQGKTAEQAQQYVIDVLQSTQGDFSRIGAPLLLKRIPKVMAQYRKYQFMMMAFYVKAFNQAFKGATAEERTIGRRMLAFKLTHTAVAAGALGLPLMNVIGMMFGPDDDDPEDLEMWLKSKIGNEDLANLLLHGVSSVTPMDMSAKLGEENIFSIAPYTDFDLTSREGVAKTAAGIAGGPAMGLAQKMADGVGLIQDGQMTKGIERMLPSGLGSALSAFRMVNEGFSLKNGDVVVKPGDMEAWGLALTAVGLPASQVKELTKERGVQFQLNKHFDDRTKEIRNEYSAAWRDKDREKMAEMRKEWVDLQSQKRIARKRYFNNNPKELRVAPLSSLIKTPIMERRRARTESRSLSE
jgi:hypothetical protein